MTCESIINPLLHIVLAVSTKVVSHSEASTVHTATMRFGMHLPNSAPQTHVELCGTKGSQYGVVRK